jgi:hypothetical protein
MQIISIRDKRKRLIADVLAIQRLLRNIINSPISINSTTDKVKKFFKETAYCSSLKVTRSSE